MRLFRVCLTVLSACLLSAVSHADTFHFTLDQNGDDYVFTIDTAATPTFADPVLGQAFTTPVTETYQGAAYPVNGTNVYFGPGYLLFSELEFTTPVLYQNATFTPTLPGAPLQTYRFNDPTDIYTLTITSDAPTAPSATPEPSSLALLGTGIAGMLGAARRRIIR